MLDLSGVTVFTGSPGNAATVQALAGGQVKLGQLGTISTERANITADGPGSSIDLSSLASLSVSSPMYDQSSLAVTNGGAIAINPSLTALDYVNLTLQNSTHLATSQLTKFTHGTLSVDGVATDFNALTDITGSSFLVSGGVTLALRAATSYVPRTDLYASHANGTFQASGAGSILELPNTTAFSATNPYYPYATTVQALDGGQVKLSKVAVIDNAPVQFTADGPGSGIDLSTLASLGGYFSSLAVKNGGAITINPNLTTLDDVDLTLQGSTNLATSQLTKFTRGTLSVDGVATDFNGLMDITGSSFLVSGGVTLALPAATSYDAGGRVFYAEGSFQASGVGSVLDLSNLTAFSPTTYAGSTTTVQALDGGHVKLGKVLAVNAGGVRFASDGPDSSIDLSSLASFSGYSSYHSGLAVKNSGAIVVNPSLTALDGVDLTLSGSTNLATSQLTKFTHGTLSVDGVPTDFSGLTDITRSSFLVSGGVTLSLPAIAGYDTGGVASTAFTAYGAESILDLSGVTVFTGSASNSMTVTAYAGGQVRLGQLGTMSTGRTAITADGPGSSIDLSSLTSPSVSYGSLTERDGGAIAIGQDLTNLDNVDLTLYGSTSIATKQLTAFTHGTLSLYGFAPDFSGLRDITGSSVVVGWGATFCLPPAITIYDVGDRAINTRFEANGSGSVLDLSALTSYAAHVANETTISASYGGQVKIGGIPAINTGRVTISASGAGSSIDLLTS